MRPICLWCRCYGRARCPGCAPVLVISSGIRLRGFSGGVRFPSRRAERYSGYRIGVPRDAPGAPAEIGPQTGPRGCYPAETAPPRENYKAACLHTDRYVHAFRARTVPAGALWACVNIGTPAYPDRVAGRARSAPHNHANRGRAQTLPQPRTLGGPPNALCGARAGTGHSTAALQRSTHCSALRDIRAAAREPRAFHGQRQISWRSCRRAYPTARPTAACGDAALASRQCLPTLIGRLGQTPPCIVRCAIPSSASLPPVVRGDAHLPTQVSSACVFSTSTSTSPSTSALDICGGVLPLLALLPSWYTRYISCSRRSEGCVYAGGVGSCSGVAFTYYINSVAIT